MRFSLGTFLATAMLATYALGRPLMSQRPLLWSFGAGETQCSTDHAAIASDCQLLLENPPTPDWINVAAPDSTPIFKPFCSGSCCVFTDMADVAFDALVSAGDTLMGCSQLANGLIKGVTKTQSGQICMADSTGANSCFQ
ncbi:hypothetical protein C8F04DRAFT_1398662 [Mycena alexandri]|uniref:Uncharacterized protein n=1 Tax=Mycena alexandri TaxID=1745969 RepID=A0AAD6SK05_9AGAR|nr:hypothetical protein C8F04DRAFT_1398662 [Mycena alexandri]